MMQNKELGKKIAAKLFTFCISISVFFGMIGFSGLDAEAAGVLRITFSEGESAAEAEKKSKENKTDDIIEEIPAYTGEPYIEVHDNKPFFEEKDLTTDLFEKYSEQDELGRCGTAYANVCVKLLPKEERDAIGDVKPTGWHTVKYSDIIDGLYLYNRCHLIGYQLTGENANEKNLITGTRYLNIEGMLPFENMVEDYVKRTENHVLYRVTPVFDGDNMVASGVLMEAQSVEDKGTGVLFCVYCYNVQPGVVIDYATGESRRDESAASRAVQALEIAADAQEEESSDAAQTETKSAPVFLYIGNKNTGKFHYSDCKSVDVMKESNKFEYEGTRDEMIEKGFEPCMNCNP